MVKRAANASPAILVAFLVLVFATNTVSAQTPLNGKYRGTRTLQDGGNPNCAGTIPVTMSFLNGNLLNFYGNKEVPLPLSPDGTFSTVVYRMPTMSDKGPVYVTVHITGSVKGENVSFLARAPSCRYVYELVKLPPSN